MDSKGHAGNPVAERDTTNRHGDVAMMTTNQRKEFLLEKIENLRDLVEKMDIDDAQRIARQMSRELDEMLDAVEPGRLYAKQGFTRYEVDSIYCEPDDRFVVSLVSTYGPANTPGVNTPLGAAAACLSLTRDGESDGTRWTVFDRKTGLFHWFNQWEL